MPHPDSPSFDYDALRAEIAEDEKVDCEAKRLLSQTDIRRLIEAQERRRPAAESPAQSS